MTMIRPVILSGGAGTRLWPLSVPERPKQLHALTSERTMLQETALRVADPALFGSPILIANARHADEIELQVSDIGIADALTILEPAGRNTAPAIGLAALAAQPDDILLILPSDHVIADAAGFRAAIETGAALASDGWLVTLGIQPDRPETGYGYIRRGLPLAGGAFVADAFVEKPDRATAEAYLADGDYYWNGGIFLFRAGRLIEELEAYAPDILGGLRRAMAGARRADGRLYPDPDAFAEVRAESIDYAVMEKSDRLAVVPVAMGWSDLGSWDALYDHARKDGAGNVSSGTVTMIDSAGCLLHGDGRRLVAVGVEDLIVIATADAVLILPRGESQRVKEAVDKLDAMGGRLP